MRRTITLVIALISLIARGQSDQELIIGKWKYSDVYEKEKLDAKEQKMIQMLFGEMTLQFDDANNYKASLMGANEQGRWKYEDKKTIILNSDKGNVTSIKIVDISSDTLVVKLQRGIIIMTRQSVGESEEIEANTKKFETVSATTEQVARKWYLQSRRSTTDAPEDIKAIANKLLKGSFINFKKNGDYEVNVFNIEENGTWEFGENNESIITSVGDQKKVWSIVKISDSELILMKGISEEKWTFSLER